MLPPTEQKGSGEQPAEGTGCRGQAGTLREKGPGRRHGGAGSWPLGWWEETVFQTGSENRGLGGNPPPLSATEELG